MIVWTMPGLIAGLITGLIEKRWHHSCKYKGWKAQSHSSLVCSSVELGQSIVLAVHQASTFTQINKMQQLHLSVLTQIQNVRLYYSKGTI